MSVTDLCHEYGISRPTAYKWIKCYDEVGPGACSIWRAHAAQFSIRNIGRD
jgi:transposase-like protein